MTRHCSINADAHTACRCPFRAAPNRLGAPFQVDGKRKIRNAVIAKRYALNTSGARVGIPGRVQARVSHGFSGLDLMCFLVRRHRTTIPVTTQIRYPLHRLRGSVRPRVKLENRSPEIGARYGTLNDHVVQGCGVLGSVPEQTRGDMRDLWKENPWAPCDARGPLTVTNLL